MVNWSPLRSELAIWSREGRALPFWWRDDDATCPTKSLDRLGALADSHATPVHLAVIPARASDALASVVSTTTFRAVAHGWAHENTAPEFEKKSEFGYPYPGAVTDAQRGLERLNALFHTNVYAMFVPPWNRIAQPVIDGLHGAGFCYLSTFTPRARRFAAPNLIQINTHIDPVDWRGTGGLLEPAIQIENLVAHLEDRRQGRADAEEPLGLLTHHLVQDDQTWAFCEALLQELRAVPLKLFDIAQAPNGEERWR